jgi:SAM-dependent methyltransferase
MLQMNLKATLIGTWRRIKAIRYLLREQLGLPRTERNQTYTSESFEKYFARDVRKFKKKGTRIGRVGHRFAEVTTTDLEIEIIRTHLAGIEAAIGGRSAPARLLEVGAGYGRTLSPLSLLLPNAKLNGIELTRSGPEAALRYWNEARPEIEHIAGAVGPITPRERPWEQFATGDGKNISFPDESFDVAYTNLVLEQVPYREDSERVIREMWRVSKRAACFLEPWADAQSKLNRAYVRQNGYFGESTQILKDVGFRKIEYKNLGFQHNLLFRLGYAVAYK